MQSESGEILLLDCGCKYSKILKGISYRITDVVGCLLTHEHGDHSKSHKDIIQSGIRIYTNNETVKSMNIMPGELMIGIPERKLKEIKEFKVIPFYVKHDETPNFAYLIKHPECGTLLYITDFMCVDYTFRSVGINHFLIECNHLDDAPEKDNGKYGHSIKGHSCLSTVNNIILANKTVSLKTITLCHLSNDWSNPERMQKEIQKAAGDDVLVQVARPGLEIDLNLCPF